MKNLYSAWSGFPGRVALVALLCLTLQTAFSQSPPYSGHLGFNQAAANIDQARNGKAAAPVNPIDWVNGNAGAQTAHYIEGYSIPYRVVLTNVPGSTEILSMGGDGLVHLVLEYDIKHSGRHALDYLTQYDRLEPHTQFTNANPGHLAEDVNPLYDPSTGFWIFPEGAAPNSYGNIPAPGSLGSPVTGMPATSFNALGAGEKVFTMWGGNITNVTYGAQADLTASQSSQQIYISFEPLASTIVLAWGGHIASRLDWGYDGIEPRSAGGISGSPYHMRLIDWNLNNLGNQDRSLSTDAVVVFPPCEISGPELVCTSDGPVEYHADVTSQSEFGFTFQWSLLENTSGATIVSGTETSQTVSINPGNTSGTYKLKVLITNVQTGVTSTCYMHDDDCNCPETIEGALAVQVVSVAATASSTDETCSGSNNGTATASGSGGTEPYTFAWTGPDGYSSSSQNISGLAAGTYAVTVTDANGCYGSASVEISVPDPLEAGATGTDATCVGANTGSASATASGGTEPYTFSWSGPNGYSGTGAIISNISAGIYTVIVQDGNGCTAQASVTINVDDTTAPVITGVGEDATIECPATPEFSNPLASDDSGAVELTYEDVTTPGSCPNEYMVTRTWTATDACGNSVTDSQTITVSDNTPPVIEGVGGAMTIECPATPVFSVPTAADACGDVTITYEDLITNGSCANEYSVTRTWTATDACGNTSTASQTIVVEDNTAPVITGVGAPMTIACTATPVFSQPYATDDCGEASLTYLDVRTDGSCANEYSITRTWTATDACGNTTTAFQTITVEDNTAPVITGVGGPMTISCPAAPVFSQPLATDDCGDVTLTYQDVRVDGSCANEYIITRTWTAVDACGNLSTASQTISVEDNTPPVITGVGGPETIECPLTPVFSEPTAIDECGDVSLTYQDIRTAGSCANEYNITRTWTATDACGNTATASQTINVTDNTAPVITGVGGAMTIECPAIPVFSTPSASDDCGDVTLTYQDARTAGACANEYSITRTWTATDACGNATSASQTITVEDNTVPVITGVGGPMTIECPAAPFFSEPTASDECGIVTLTFVDVQNAGGCDNEYSITRTWTATDACGNTSSASQTITVEDNTPPVIAGVGGPMTIECPSSPVFSEPTASDACGSVTLTFVDVTTPGQCDNEYSVTRTWTASDACGNSSSASQTITVVDNTAPVISGVGGPMTIECPSTPVFSEPTASDACGTATITYSDFRTAGGCDNEYTITRTWTATDACGNTSTASQTINVVDNTAPVITGVGGPLTIACPDTPVFSEPLATDDCGSVTMTYNDVRSPGACDNEYSITRTWTAVDACGNTSSASQTITVEDNTAPVIIGVGGPMTIECPDAPVFSEPSASDECGSVTLTFSDFRTAGACDNEYSITRTWTAVDACGNTSTASQTITVEDNTAPAIVGVGDPMRIECPANPVFSEPTASDACGVVTMTYSDVRTAGACDNEYSITRTWTATDACGNATTASQTITVEDNTPPVIAGVGGPMTIECPATPVFSEPTASDACGAVTLTFIDEQRAGDCANEYSLIRTWIATDACGNTASASQTITVADNTAPVISGVGGPMTIECPASPVFSQPTANDECGAVTLTFADVRIDGECANQYSVTRTWTATDACGNTSKASQTITVEDNTAPIIAGVGGPMTIECTVTPQFSEPTANDACGTVQMVFVDVRTVGQCPNEYSITRTWTAADACGNTASASQTINVVDTTPPVIAGIGNDMSIECPDSPQFSEPTATDACGNATMTFADVTTPGSCDNEYSVTRTWTAIDACGNTTTASQTITVVDNSAPVISGIPDDISLCAGDAVSFALPTASDGCSGAVEVNFVVTDENGNAVEGLTTSGGVVSGTLPMGYFTILFTAVDACGNASDASALVSNPIPVTCSIDDPGFDRPVCGAHQTNTLSVTAMDGFGNYSYEWTVTASNPADAENWSVWDGQGTSSIIFEAGNGSATFTVTVTDANGCTSTCTIDVSGCSEDYYCTYTQGFYGNEGGGGCSVSGRGASAEEMMLSVLPFDPNNGINAVATFGLRSTGNYFELFGKNIADGSIFNMLPGGATPVALKGYATYDLKSSWGNVPIVNKGGKVGSISNVLLAQAITLYFNIGQNMAFDLASLEITGQYLITADAEDCGLRRAVPYQDIYTVIPQSVIDYLVDNYGKATVANLLDLANRLLGDDESLIESAKGSKKTYLVSPSDVTKAMDAINRGFDECRVFIKFNTQDPATARSSYSPIFAGTVEITEMGLSDAETFEIQATSYPNPFVDKVNIEFISPVSTKVTLNIYSITGIRIKTVFDGNVEANRVYRFEFSDNQSTNGLYIFRVETSDRTTMGKMIRLRN